MMNKHTTLICRTFAVAVTFLMTMALLWSNATVAANAATETVTLKFGAVEQYGTYNTRVRWITHINGEPVDLDDEPGVTRSYAYCVQPALGTPDAGVYNVTVVDDDDTGRLDKMRKMIYYLPGAYGYKAVTKARWFSSLPANTSAYTLGHVALSYLYDNCNNDTDAFMGTGDAIKSKVKKMITDMNDLPDPPSDFEVFWIKVKDCQDTFGAFYKSEYGKLAVEKSSALPEISDNNRCYTLAGANYTVFTDSACTQVAKTSSNGDAIITTNADGSSDQVELETGTYYIAETLAPKGYALNTRVASVTVSKDQTTVYSDSDVPKSNEVSVLVEKVDAETGLAKAQGAASLKDAEFTIRYYDSDSSQGEFKRTWVFRTDEEGKFNMQEPDKYMVDGSDKLYINSAGKVTIPIGTITITETKAPKGYCLNEEVFTRQITEAGSVENLSTLKTLTGNDAVKEQVKRGDFSFTKSSKGWGRMCGIPFKVTSLTTGETHCVITDANGYVNTEAGWNLHTTMNDEKLSDENGIWFNGYNDEKSGAKARDNLAALPYDRYKLEELRCEANTGYTLINDVITISRNNTLVIMGTYDDELEPVKYVPEDPVAVQPKVAAEVKPADNKEKETKKTSPKTGDEAMLLLYAIEGALAMTEAGLLTARKKNDRLCNEEKKER